MPELPVVAWITDDGRVATAQTKLVMGRPSKESFNDPLCKVSDALTYASQTLASRDGEIARLREALNALVDRNFTFFSGTMVGADKAIRQKEVQAARAALAPQPTKEQSNG